MLTVMVSSLVTAIVSADEASVRVLVRTVCPIRMPWTELVRVRVAA